MDNILSVNMITDEEQSMMRYAMANYSDNDNSITPCELSHFLRFWTKEKQDLFNLMGKKDLILSKEIFTTKTAEQIKQELADGVGGHLFLDKVYWFANALWSTIPRNREYSDMVTSWHSSDNAAIQEWVQNCRSHANNLEQLVSMRNLASNVWDGDEIIMPKADCSGVFKIPHGTKIIKALRKLAEAYSFLGMELFEDFRIIHSQILNQKTLKGTLCLSIHPLDFFTMSDNDCGWESCMSWFNSGDYRMGTIEMMNSPMVICAYLKSEKDMSYCGGKWNNKKWRQLFIIREDSITAIRSYPYDNENLTRECMSWLRQLAKDNWGQEYFDDYFCLENHCNIAYPAGNIERICTNIETRLMYNDLCHDNHWTTVNKKFEGQQEIHLDYCYSGKAVCTDCGAVLDEECHDSYYGNSCLLCFNCNGRLICADCGEMIYADDACWYEGVPYCSYCYDSFMSYCVCCGEDCHHGDLKTIDVYLAADEFLRDVQMCDHCFKNELMTLGIELKESRWGNIELDLSVFKDDEKTFYHLMTQVLNHSDWDADNKWNHLQEKFKASEPNPQ